MSTDSHGVLADVRTGGLKRDLSHAFAGSKDWDETMEDAAEQSGNNWMDDFLGFIYRDRVHVLKSVPMEKKTRPINGMIPHRLNLSMITRVLWLDRCGGY